jgi:oligopeptide transport system substrate-binding protein
VNQSGPTLNLYSSDPYTLDPATVSDADSAEYVMQIFSGLVKLDNNLEVVPDIAESWQISSDRTTYTFSLRHDARFQDGKGVKAADFKYSWERACNPATGSQTAASYLGDIVGVSDMLAGKNSSISGVKAIDDYTLQVTIDSPKSYFLFKLTYPTSFVVDRSNVSSGQNWWQKPNGIGPFKLNSWQQNSQLVLGKNEKYYGEVAKVGQVVFQFYTGVPMDLYETGKIDVTGISADYIDKVQDESGTYYQELMVAPELSVSYIGFNCTRPPFDDANIRRAFSQAIDKDKIISLIFRDMVQRADGILPPGMNGYNSGLNGLDFDVQKALRLVKESKYGDVSNLPAITLTTSGWGGAITNDIQAMVYQWQQNLGVEVQVKQIEPERFFYNLKEDIDEMFITGWIADYPHPQDFLEILFRTGTDNNSGGYSNAGIDALLQSASLEPDEQKSLELYQQAEKILVDDAACIPLTFGKSYTLIKPYVQGYYLNPMGFAMLNLVSVKAH